MELWVERHTITEEYSDFGQVWDAEENDRHSYLGVRLCRGGANFH